MLKNLIVFLEMIYNRVILQTLSFLILKRNMMSEASFAIAIHEDKIIICLLYR